MRRRTLATLTIAAAWLQLTGCGASVEEPRAVRSVTSPSIEQNYRWPLSATVTLTRNGPEPASVTINVGGRVTFVNQDVRVHEIVSDPYLRHEECPAINRVGHLAPGQQRESAIFEATRTCGWHDHLDPTGLVGRIDVRIE
jgi:plastocyanin